MNADRSVQALISVHPRLSAVQQNSILCTFASCERLLNLGKKKVLQFLHGVKIALPASVGENRL
jgi:hypothetical protein